MNNRMSFGALTFVGIGTLLGCANLGKTGGGGGGGGGGGRTGTSAGTTVPGGPVFTAEDSVTQGDGPGGNGAQFAQCNYAPGPDQLVTATPDPTRTFDSAVYARAALQANLAPNPNLLRLNDFLNLYGSSSNYADAPADGEIEYLPSEGIVEARFRIPADKAPVSRAFVVLVDTSFSMAPRFELERSIVDTLAGRMNPTDDLKILGWSTQLESINEGGTIATLDAALTSAFESPGASSDLALALPTALELASSSTREDRHVIVLTDGGVESSKLGAIAQSFAIKGVRLDVVLTAVASDLDGGGPHGARAYNQPMLSALTPIDGARLLVTDSVGAGGVSDVEELFGSRFDELFGSAIPSPRVILTLPSILKFVPTEHSSTTADELLSRSVGFDRMLVFRARVTEAMPLAEIGICQPFLLSATIDGIPGTTGPTLVQSTVDAAPTSLGVTRKAVTAFVEALRTSKFTAARSTLDGAKLATCAKAPSNDPLCSANTEMVALLARHPANH